MSELILRSEPSPGVGLIVLNRPEAANAFNTALAREVGAAFAALSATDCALRCVVLTGAGERAFCAGADLKERDGMTDQAWADQHLVFEAMAEAVLKAPMPVIAAVNGPAYGGGCELALLCDLIYAAEGARFALPEASLGIMPGLGATQILSRRTGAARAKEIILSAQPFTTADALSWGMVNRVCPTDRLMEEALALAARIAANAPLATRAIKAAIDAGSDLPLDRGMALELEAYNRLFPTQDRMEGVRAWREKRKAMFRGA
jgi:enoyl-CoA hydratase/carnithine racemase